LTAGLPDAGAKANPATYEGRKESLINISIAVVIESIALSIIPSRVSDDARINDLATGATRLTHGLTDTLSACRFRGTEAFIIPSIAIGIYPIACRITTPDRTKFACVDLRAIDAPNSATRRTDAGAAAAPNDFVIFIDVAIAICIHPIAQVHIGIRFFWSTCVDENPVLAHPFTRSTTDSLATFGRHGRHILICTAIAIGISTIAHIIIIVRSSWSTLFDEEAFCTGENAGSSTCSNAALDVSKHMVFVNNAVTIIINTVARINLRSRLTRNALFHRHTIHARRDAIRCTCPLTTFNGIA